MNTYLTPEQWETVSKIRVGIAGAGGLGSNCAAHLVRSGITKLVLADMDTVSQSNLNRQFYFADQIGRAKVAALAENLRRIAPELELETFAQRVTPTNAPEIFAACDYVIEAFDEVGEKAYFVNRMLSEGKTVVAASGIAGWGRSNEMRAKSFGAKLYVCGDFSTETSDDFPPTSPRVGIAAAMQANIVMALILGLDF